jgi:hypothetical protein
LQLGIVTLLHRREECVDVDDCAGSFAHWGVKCLKA